MSAYLEDLTGSKIVADKPLSVISGHECAFVNSTSCDNLIVQVLPTILWDTTYYIAPLTGGTSYTVKIIAAYNGTRIQLTCNKTHDILLLNDGDCFNQTYRKQEYCAIHSNKKISVVQLSNGTDIGDPMMTLIPAVNGYSSNILSSINYQLSRMEYWNYINIIVMAEYHQPKLIKLNTGRNGRINKTLESSEWVPIIVNNTIEAFATQVDLGINAKIFQIIHFNKSALMSAIVFGFGKFMTSNMPNVKVGYGHPAILNIFQEYP